MLQAMTAAMRSKDPRTKVGCVIVDRENHQVGMGYNGFLAGIDESCLPWGSDTDEPLEHQKYGHVIHAESNALLHTTKDLRGSRAYVTHFPCHECAKLLAGKRVAEIVYLSDKHRGSDSNTTAKRIFDLSGIAYRKLSMDKNVFDRLGDHMGALMADL